MAPKPDTSLPFEGISSILPPRLSDQTPVPQATSRRDHRWKPLLGEIALNATSNVQTAEPFESELTIELEPWARHSAADWIARLAASLSTIQQTVWERRPQVVAQSERKAHLSLDGYGRDVADANEHAEILLRRHTPFAGLTEGSYIVTATSKRRA